MGKRKNIIPENAKIIVWKYEKYKKVSNMTDLRAHYYLATTAKDTEIVTITDI